MNHVVVALLLISASASAAPEIVNARGQWATLRTGQSCEAATRTINQSAPGARPGRASLSFDAGGPRHGQFSTSLSLPRRADSAVLLTIGGDRFLLVADGGRAWSRGPAQEQAIMAALRRSQGMRVEARTPAGGRIVDRYSLSGAPTAIDAAAACAARLANR